MKKYLFLLILGFGLQACGGEASSESKNTDSTQATESEISQEAEIIENEPEQKGLTAGNFCYKFANKTTTEFIKLELKEDGTASGVLTGLVEDEANGYFASYDMKLEEGSTWTAQGVDVKLTIEVDGDTQHEEQMWKFDGGHFIIRDDIYSSADCSEEATLFGQ